MVRLRTPQPECPNALFWGDFYGFLIVDIRIGRRNGRAAAANLEAPVAQTADRWSLILSEHITRLKQFGVVGWRNDFGHIQRASENDTRTGRFGEKTKNEAKARV